MQITFYFETVYLELVDAVTHRIPFNFILCPLCVHLIDQRLNFLELFVIRVEHFFILLRQVLEVSLHDLNTFVNFAITEFKALSIGIYKAAKPLNFRTRLNSNRLNAIDLIRQNVKLVFHIRLSIRKLFLDPIGLGKCFQCLIIVLITLPEFHFEIGDVSFHLCDHSQIAYYFLGKR